MYHRRSRSIGSRRRTRLPSVVYPVQRPLDLCSPPAPALRRTTTPGSCTAVVDELAVTRRWSRESRRSRRRRFRPRAAALVVVGEAPDEAPSSNGLTLHAPAPAWNGGRPAALVRVARNPGRRASASAASSRWPLLLVPDDHVPDHGSMLDPRRARAGAPAHARQVALGLVHAQVVDLAALGPRRLGRVVDRQKLRPHRGRLPPTCIPPATGPRTPRCGPGPRPAGSYQRVVDPVHVVLGDRRHERQRPLAGLVEQ